VAGRLGFCGLDRKREPLLGDEVRACWEDGAIPRPPDPAMPGLLDLLTAPMLGAAVGPRAADDEPLRPAARRASADDLPRHRRWVEVEA
jgi:hypothetical protein